MIFRFAYIKNWFSEIFVTVFLKMTMVVKPDSQTQNMPYRNAASCCLSNYPKEYEYRYFPMVMPN